MQGPGGDISPKCCKKNEKDDGNYIPALSAQGKRLEVCAKVSTEVNSGYRPFV